MKKAVVISIAVIMILITSVIAYANNKTIIEADKCDYSIMVNQEEISNKVPSVIIEDRIYIQLRSLCDMLGFDIRWDALKNEAKVSTDECGINDDFESGYYGIDGWKGTRVDFELSKDVAISIANDVFINIKGEKFLSETVLRVKDDEKYYYVYRYYTENDLPVPGGDLTVVIRKNDGKIMRVELGE